MTDKAQIMIVDDAPANCKLLESFLLAQNYEPITCRSGQECLEQLTQHKPEIILLDVMMPGLNGYEVCSRIKENKEINHIPIIFISALDTLDDRLNGYNAGGDDYLGKPVDLSILLKKITLVMSNKQIKRQLKHDVEEMQSGFMNALNTGEEFGQVTHFVEQCLQANNYEQLFQAVFESMKNFNLKTSAQIRYNDQVITLNSDGEKLPLEKELMLKAQFDSQILEVGSKMFISYVHFSLLIKNSPIDDTIRIERLKEHLVAIAKVCNHRIKSIAIEKNAQYQKDISSLFQEGTSSLEALHSNLETHIQKALTITQNMSKKVIDEHNISCLDEKQKKELMSIVHYSSTQCKELSQELSTLMNEHNIIKTTLQKIIEKINSSLN